VILGSRICCYGFSGAHLKFGSSGEGARIRSSSRRSSSRLMSGIRAGLEYKSEYFFS